MSDDENQIECAEHGKTPATFICRHLSEGEGLGFHEGHDPENPDDLYPDAWCDACEEVLEREGEWNDTSEGFANIKIVCANCYQDIRERNWKQDDDAFNHMISTSFDYLKNLQDAFMDAYDIGKHERWDWDQETGKLIFSDEENRSSSVTLILSAQYQPPQTPGCGHGRMNLSPKTSNNVHGRYDALASRIITSNSPVGTGRQTKSMDGK